MGEDRRTEGEMSRYTVEEAAAVLSLTVGAVRNRLGKGILRSVEESGTVYVLLPAYLSRGAPPDTPARTTRDAPRDAGGTGGMPGTSGAGTSGALISEMSERIAFLEREMEKSGALVSELRERVALLEREVEGEGAISPNTAGAAGKDVSPPAREDEPSGPRGSPEAPTERLERVEARPPSVGPQRGSVPRSRWRRMFGG